MHVNHMFNHVNNLDPRRKVRTRPCLLVHVERMRADESDGCQKNANFGAKNKFSFTLEKMCFNELKELSRTCERTRMFENVFSLIFNKL